MSCPGYVPFMYKGNVEELSEGATWALESEPDFTSCTALAACRPLRDNGMQPEQKQTNLVPSQTLVHFESSDLTRG